MCDVMIYDAIMKARTNLLTNYYEIYINAYALF